MHTKFINYMLRPVRYAHYDGALVNSKPLSLELTQYQTHRT